jgi:L-ascorbate metabolism protein UlaG (beta-lactamase superfamily)
MNGLSCLVAVLVAAVSASVAAEESFVTDVVKTSASDLRITFIGHATLVFTFGERVVHVDPVGQMADYTKLPKADLVLITHEHGDHLDPSAVEMVRTGRTEIVLTEACAKRVQGGIVMKNGDTKVVKDLRIEAVPAYNIVHKRGTGQPFHPKGVGNGYVVTFGDKRVYIAGDTENTPEMKSLKNIDIAFLPMNLPYTMTPEMVADAVRAFKPSILYPYHFSDTDTSRIADLLKGVEGIEVRIRKMK